MDIHYVNRLARESLELDRPSVTRRLRRDRIYAISKNHPDHDLDEKKSAAKEGIISGEPWPFSDPLFCYTGEEGSPYLNFANPSGFIVGNSAAYCSAMICRITTLWPVPVDHRFYPNIGHYALARQLWTEAPRRFDPKNWGAFLALNHFTRHVASPETGHYYVGIKPDEGDSGLVVWFQHYDGDDPDFVFVSTRIDHQFTVLRVPVSDYDWVEIR